MVKNFKGEVKISDVKTEFDNLVDRINNMVEAYNISGQVEDIDYSVGGVNLSPAGYTLSVGGLKQGLNSVDRNVIGAKCFRVSDNKLKITDGLILTKKGAIRLPDSVITKPLKNNTLYYNTTTNQYQWVPGDNWEEKQKVAVLKSNNKLNPETGLYYFEHNATPLNFFHGLTGRAPNFPLYGNPIILGEITVDMPRYVSDSESIVNKLILNLPDYQYVNLPQSEMRLQDIVIECDCGDEGYASFAKFFSGILLGSFTPNEAGLDRSTFDPRVCIRNHWEINYSSGQFQLHFGDATELSDNSRFYPNTDGGLNFADGISYNPGKYQLYSTPAGESRELANDVMKYKLTIEEHNERLMVVNEFTFKTKTWDHYDGDLYANANTKFSDNHMYMFLYLDDKYKDMKVGNVALLAAGGDFSGIHQTYFMSAAFNPDLIKVCNTHPVTSEANVYYTVLESDGESEDVYKICDLNMNRDSKFITDISTIQTENFDGHYKITSGNRTFGGWDTLRSSNVSRESNEAIFISGIDAERFEREGTSYVYLLGDNVAWNRQPGHRNLNYWTPVNMLYVPKGIDNPFIVSNGNASKSFKVIVDKKVE